MEKPAIFAPRRHKAVHERRRASKGGFKSPGLETLKEAYRRLLRSGLSFEDALGSLEDFADPLVAQLIAFARNSSRGFCHEERKERRAKGKERRAKN